MASKRLMFTESNNIKTLNIEYHNFFVYVTISTWLINQRFFVSISYNRERLIHLQLIINNQPLRKGVINAENVS